MNRIRAQQGLSAQTGIGVKAQASARAESKAAAASRQTKFEKQTLPGGFGSDIGYGRGTGDNTAVSGRGVGDADQVGMRTPAQKADDEASADHGGLTMEEANDPKYWSGGKFVGKATETVPTSPISTYVPPPTTIDRPILVSDQPKYKPYGETEAGRAEAAASGQPEAPSLQSIRQEQLDLAQDAIDATQAEYMATRRRLRDEGQGLMGVTSSYAVSAGLAGSPFQQAMEKRQQAENNRVLEDAAAKRSSAVSGLMQQAEINAQSYYQSAIENFRAEREWNASEEEKAAAEGEAVAAANKKAASDFILNVAKAGQSIDDIPQADYASLLDASGYTDFEARAIWALNTPAANAKYEMKDGYLVQTYFDPVTQKPSVTVDRLPEGTTEKSRWQPVDFDGNTYLVDMNDPLDEDGKPKFKLLGATKKTTEKDGILSVADAKALGVPYGTTEAQAMAMGITPGTETAGSLSTTAIMKTDQAKRLQGLVDLKDAIVAYKSLVIETGSASAWSPGDRERLNSSREFIALALKNAEDLGALQEPDIELIDRQIPKVTTEGFSSLVIPRPFAASRALVTIEDVLAGYAQKAQNQYDQLIAAGASPYDPFVKDLSDKLGIKPSATGGGAVSAKPWDRSYATLEDALADHPEIDAQVQSLISANPNMTQSDVLQVIEEANKDFTNDLSTSGNGSPTTISLGERKVTVSSSISNRLAMADKEYFAATGEHIKVNEATRSRERQAELYVRFKAGKGGRAAPPGKSFHETGNAVDVANWEKAGPYLRKHGFRNDLADDRNHFSIGEFA